MALQKSYTLRNGITGNYWKIGKGNTVELPKTIYLKEQGKLIGYLNLYLYVDATSRLNAPDMPIKEFRVNFEFSASDYPDLSIPMNDFYEYVKNNWAITHTEQNGVDESGNPVYTEVVDFDLKDAVNI